MDSLNFEMLRNRWPELSTRGGFAEQYAHSDSQSALIKLRTFSEHLVEGIYQTHDIPLPYQRNLFGLLGEEPVYIRKISIGQASGRICFDFFNSLTQCAFRGEL